MSAKRFSAQNVPAARAAYSAALSSGSAAPYTGVWRWDGSAWSATALTTGVLNLDAVTVWNGQIVVGGTVVAEGTSSGGPLSCSAEIE